MDSRSSRPTQPDNGLHGSFRVKLRVKCIICEPRPWVGEYQRPTLVPWSMAQDMARLFPTGPEARTMRHLGLLP